MPYDRKWTFDAGRSNFSFVEDAFGSDASLRRERADGVVGAYDATGGYDGTGGLVVELGGVEAGRRMSAAWARDFSLDANENVTLVFRYRLTQDAGAEADEFIDLRVAVDGERIAVDGERFVARIYGDGPGGSVKTSGWQTVKIDLGPLSRGAHEIEIGAFANEVSGDRGGGRLRIDDVRLKSVDDTFQLDSMEADVLRFTNRFRREHGLDPLKADPNLSAAAEQWSRKMAREDFFHHSEVGDFIASHGYDSTGYGENIAAGYLDARAVVDAWIDSPGHRANLLRADFEHIGIGYFRLAGDGGDLRYQRYWTQEFGVPADDYLA